MNIRRAVGAVILRNGQVLLVHKVRRMDGQGGPVEIPGEWDFPKGGVKAADADLTAALLRELAEETGSQAYRVLRQFTETIRFTFTPEDQVALGFTGQETTMFLLEYLGCGGDLCPQDEEIERLGFFDPDAVERVLAHPEGREFFRRTVLPLIQAGVYPA